MHLKLSMEPWTHWNGPYFALFIVMFVFLAESILKAVYNFSFICAVVIISVYRPVKHKEQKINNLDKAGGISMIMFSLIKWVMKYLLYFGCTGSLFLCCKTL